MATQIVASNCIIVNAANMKVFQLQIGFSSFFAIGFSNFFTIHLLTRFLLLFHSILLRFFRPNQKLTSISCEIERPFGNFIDFFCSFSLRLVHKILYWTNIFTQKRMFIELVANTLSLVQDSNLFLLLLFKNSPN